MSEEKSKIIDGCWEKLFDNKDVIQKSHGYIIIGRFYNVSSRFSQVNFRIPAMVSQ